MNAQIEMALNALQSAIHKCEKALSHLPAGSAQHKWVVRQLTAYTTAVSLLQGPGQSHFTAEQLQSCAATFAHLIQSCEKMLPKFAPRLRPANRPASRSASSGP